MKNYNYSLLSEKYNALTEGASLALRKEMFKEECWDASADRPIPECWTESGDIKDECWSSGPGGTNSVDGGTVVDEVEDPVIQQADDTVQPISTVETSPKEIMRSIEKNISKLESMLIDVTTDEATKAEIEKFLYNLYEQATNY